MNEQRRQDVYAGVDPTTGEVVQARMTKANAHKWASNAGDHTKATIVLDPDAREGDILKSFKRKQTNEGSLSPKRVGRRAYAKGGAHRPNLERAFQLRQQHRANRYKKSRDAFRTAQRTMYSQPEYGKGHLLRDPKWEGQTRSTTPSDMIHIPAEHQTLERSRTDWYSGRMERYPRREPRKVTRESVELDEKFRMIPDICCDYRGGGKGPPIRPVPRPPIPPRPFPKPTPLPNPRPNPRPIPKPAPRPMPNVIPGPPGGRGPNKRPTPPQHRYLPWLDTILRDRGKSPIQKLPARIGGDWGQKLALQRMVNEEKKTPWQEVEDVHSNKQHRNVHGMKVDHFTASALVKVHGALNKENQTKMVDAINRSPRGLETMANFSMGRVSPRKKSTNENVNDIWLNALQEIKMNTPKPQSDLHARHIKKVADARKTLDLHRPKDKDNK